MSGVRGAHVEQSGRGGRFWVWKKERYWSVTSIIGGGLPKPALINWAKKATAEYAVAHLDELNVLVKGAKTKADLQGAIDWLKGAAYRERDRAADLGSLVHDAAEAHVLGRPFPSYTDEQAPFMTSFRAFLASFEPTYLAVEAPVFSRRHRYAGRFDAIVEIPTSKISECEVWGPTPDRPWRILVDYKTGGSGPWPEVGIQTAAYRHAEFVGKPDDVEEPMPEVDGAAVLKLRPEGYEFYPVRSDDVMHEVFLYCREVFRFAQEIAPNVVGDEIVPDDELVRQLEASLEVSG